MKEPYGEGLASHTGPESCADNRKVGREALTGAQAGGVFSREMLLNQRADAVHDGGRQQRWMRNREHPLDSARSETPACRETPRARTGRPHQRPTRECERAGWRR
jgi:RNA-directed DNA polymerase